MEPEPLPGPDPAPSLADRMGRAWRDVPAATQAGGWRTGLAIAGLLALGPMLTIAGAALLSAHEQASIAAMEASPAAQRARAAEREARAVRRLAAASLSQRLEQLAKRVPSEARLTRVEVAPGEAGDGEDVAIDVATPDPDRLRAALARDPAMAGLRSVAEVRGDGVIIVTLEGRW